MGLIEVFFALKRLLLPEIDTLKFENCFVPSPLTERQFYIYRLYCLQLTTCYILPIKAQNENFFLEDKAIFEIYVVYFGKKESF